MRRLRFFPALLLILSACSENIIEQNPSDSDQMGSVSIALSTDMRNEAVASKADADEPVLDDFRVAIYKVENQMRLYNDSYANTMGKEIKLNSGEYRLVAQHGDSLGCGFNKPYYMADPTFTVDKRNVEVEAVAKLANVQLAVRYDATISEVYPDYYTVVRHGKYSGKKVKFVKGETRYGYIPGGDLILEVWAHDDGVWKTYQTDPVTYSPNDFVTFTITTDASEGNLVINIKVDSTVEDVDKTIGIPAITVPQDAPSITLAGFDGAGNVHEFIEGVNTGANAMASFVARGAVAKAVLKIESQYLASKGIPSEIDFADLSSNDKALLKSVGFAWDENMATSRKLSYIDFSGVISKMLANVRSAAQDATVAAFTLTVEDSVGKSATSSFSIVSASVKPAVSVEDHNVWATKVVSPVATINKGDISLVKLQVSADQKVWSDINDTPVQNGYTLTYGTIAAEPGTTYYVRSIYNGNEACVSPTLIIRTEDAAQVGNSGFEEFQCVDFLYTPQAGSQTAEPWYLPWNESTSDRWWDVNSKTTLRTRPTLAYQNYKCYPTVTYVESNVHGGSKAAQIATVSTGQSASEIAKGSTYAGELFIGRSNDLHQDDWAYASTGHAFSSRPSVLKFWYQYDSYDGEAFYVKIEVRDASGNVIASAERSDIGGASSWTECSLPLTYKTQTVKASSIFITFKSSSDPDPETNKKKLTFHNSDNENHYIGSVLRVDDVQLVY